MERLQQRNGGRDINIQQRPGVGPVSNDVRVCLIGQHFVVRIFVSVCVAVILVFGRDVAISVRRGGCCQRVQFRARRSTVDV
jgi:hypothetical protein